MTTQESKFGFNAKSELLNGRLAMMGLAIGFLTEILTGHGILSQLGII
jgi:hypothetical protein